MLSIASMIVSAIAWSRSTAARSGSARSGGPGSWRARVVELGEVARLAIGGAAGSRARPARRRPPRRCRPAARRASRRRHSPRNCRAPRAAERDGEVLGGPTGCDRTPRRGVEARRGSRPARRSPRDPRSRAAPGGGALVLRVAILRRVRAVVAGGVLARLARLDSPASPALSEAFGALPSSSCISSMGLLSQRLLDLALQLQGGQLQQPYRLLQLRRHGQRLAHLHLQRLFHARGSRVRCGA